MQQPHPPGKPRRDEGWIRRTLRRRAVDPSPVQREPGGVDQDGNHLRLNLEATVLSLRASNDELLQKLKVLEAAGAPTESDDDEGSARPEQTLAALVTENNVLAERVRLLHETNSTVQAKKSILQNDLELLRATETDLERQLKKTSAKLAKALEKECEATERNEELKERLKDTRAKLTESRNKVVESLKATRERLVSTSALWAEARKYFALFRQGLFADEIAKSDVYLGADTYLCLLPSTVPAAMDLQRKYGGKIICDCVENIEVERHSLAPKLHPPALDMVNLSAYGALSVVDGLMTVSGAVAQTLERFGPPVRLHPNYRWHEKPVATGNLRDQFGLNADAKVIITSGNVVRGFENVIDAMRLLPSDFHLVSLVKLSPSTYDQHIRKYLEDSGLADRVHLHGFIPYAELSSFMADADMGIIALDPENPNHAVSMPNRVFDFTTAGLPFVVPNLPEIAAYVREYDCGIAIDDVSPESWAGAVMQMMGRLGDYRSAMREARDKVTWEGLEDGLIDFLGNPQSVTLLGFRDLSRYQRFLRVADSLTARGVEVKAAFFSEDPAPIKNNSAKFYHFTDRYGRGPGLIPVPHESDGRG